jgi:hypothetical protein
MVEASMLGFVELEGSVVRLWALCEGYNDT